jgi:hypothetical protein
MRRIVDHKRVEMTNDEFTLYQNICRSYDRPNFKGDELFRDHFEVNGDGIIIFVKPPHQKYSSLEVFCFLISLMVNQHMRIVQEQNKMMIKEAADKINKQIKELEDLKVKVNELVESNGGKKSKG